MGLYERPVGGMERGESISTRQGLVSRGAEQVMHVSEGVRILSRGREGEVWRDVAAGQ